MRRLALFVGLVAGAGAAGALVEAGCATTQATTGERGEPPREREPDGGWASYVPGPSYEPKPMSASNGGGVPQMNPVVPVSPSASPH